MWLALSHPILSCPIWNNPFHTNVIFSRHDWCLLRWCLHFITVLPAYCDTIWTREKCTKNVQNQNKIDIHPTPKMPGLCNSHLKIIRFPQNIYKQFVTISGVTISGKHCNRSLGYAHFRQLIFGASNVMLLISLGNRDTATISCQKCAILRTLFIKPQATVS